MHRAVLGGFAVTLVLSLAACGGDGDTSGDDPTSSPSDTSSDDVAGIVTDTPTDVQWRVPEIPSSWQQLKTDAGEAQWQVDAACVVSLFQPAGLGEAEEPTQDQVLDDYVGRTGQAIGVTLDVSERDTSMIPLVTGSQDIAAETKVSHARLSGDGGVGGEIYAYRSGDFALVLTTFCGQGAFAEIDASDFRPFIDELAIAAEY